MTLYTSTVFFGVLLEDYDGDHIEALFDGNGVIRAIYVAETDLYLYLVRSRTDTSSSAELSLVPDHIEDRWRDLLRTEAARFGIRIKPFTGRWYQAVVEEHAHRRAVSQLVRGARRGAPAGSNHTRECVALIEPWVAALAECGSCGYQWPIVRPLVMTSPVLCCPNCGLWDGRDDGPMWTTEEEPDGSSGDS